jgi:hypothetical protein
MAKVELSDRTQLDQDLNAMALNLVVAAIVLWNTAYLDRALQVLSKEGIAIPENILPHIFPFWAGSTSQSPAPIIGMAWIGLGEGSNLSGGTLSSF